MLKRRCMMRILFPVAIFIGRKAEAHVTSITDLNRDRSKIRNRSPDSQQAATEPTLRLWRVCLGGPREKETAADGAKPRILVVDDEHVIADTLALILNKSGFKTEAAYSGEEAVEAAKSIRPDFLISDIIMPGITGIEAAIRISGSLPGCRVLLFSGNTATADLLDKAFASGHRFETLLKPVHPRDLLDRLASFA